MAILKAGVLYFAVVFGAGFALGPVRLLWAVPRFGTRAAELMEMPLMLVVIVAAARSIVRRLGVPATLSRRLSMGGVALALLLCAELALLLPLRGLSLHAYLAGLDPISGTASLAATAGLVLLGLALGHRHPRRGADAVPSDPGRRAAGIA
jgi:hypothetical protein